MNERPRSSGKSLEDIIQLADRSEISSIKSIVSGIVEIINNPDSTVKDLTRLFEADPPLTAKVLKVANSAYYGGRGRIDDIEQAVIWIGFNILKEIALNQKVCELFQKADVIGDYSRPQLWLHSVGTAILNRIIYKMEFGEKGENAYAAGLLHDIGIIVEDQFLQDDFSRILSLCKKERANLTSGEQEVLGFDHAQLGKALVGSWKFPGNLLHSIGEHHNPSSAPAQYERMVITTYVSDYLCQMNIEGYKDSPYPDKNLFEECLGILGLHTASVEILVNEMKQELEKLSQRNLF